jgi:hypothetical protein
MEGWTTFWGWTLVIVLLVFTLVSVVVTIGGFSDIKMLLKSLSQSDSSDDSSVDE